MSSVISKLFTASAIAIAMTSDAAAHAVQRRKRRARPRLRVRWPLTRRILAVNLLAPIVLVAGLLYLDRYRQGLADAELASLRTQAEMFAAAIAEGAVSDDGLFLDIMREPAAQMVRRLAEPTGVRARLFGVDGTLLADSRLLMGPRGTVKIETLAPPGSGGPMQWLRQGHDRAVDWLQDDSALPVYEERSIQTAGDYPEVLAALSGEQDSILRTRSTGGLLLSGAVPVQRYKQVVGAVMLTSSGERIDATLFEIRMAILQLFVFALAITVGVSLYLAGTIARPLRRLALAAERVRTGQARRHTIPDLSGRGDEIGELSRALREMTEALWHRMDAVETFAADVAHEIKNPLTSLRSAVETATLIKDPERQRKLMSIIQDDVARLDRLISDISDASRLDAELSRAESEPVAIRGMVETLVDVYRSTNDHGPAFTIDAPDTDELVVHGMEGRLVQVFRNLIGNAISFSPPGGTIHLTCARESGGMVVVTVADDGPGIPGNKLEAIFERFYSERPEGEKFGTHSGLGLSISKQIIEALHGTIRAENRTDSDGRVIGARFVVRLPAG